jgi:hypothetical protein
MKHLRTDYNGIQDTGGTTSIQPDEPVFILRSRDVTAPEVVHYWAEILRHMGGDRGTVTRVHAWAEEMRTWGEEYGNHVPDVPDGSLLP